jgi:DNA topoisomerase-1
MTDIVPGIRRHRTRSGFRYVDPAGRTVRDEEALARIKRLAVRAAWRDVWIAPIEEAHMQATGRDARGRKQYRYHPSWRNVRDRTKYERMIAFGEALPQIRERVQGDLTLPGLPREKLLATVVKLLESTLIRVGNEEYAKANGSVGLTTMRNRHVQVEGTKLRFEFKGKSGKQHNVTVHDRRLARIVRRLQELKGQELVQYIDDEGERQRVNPGDVNAYLREISGADFTAKDYRTWAGPFSPRWRCNSWSRSSRRRKRSVVSERQSRRSPGTWATRPRSAGSATSTQR